MNIWPHMIFVFNLSVVSRVVTRLHWSPLLRHCYGRTAVTLFRLAYAYIYRKHLFPALVFESRLFHLGVSIWRTEYRNFIGNFNSAVWPENVGTPRRLRLHGNRGPQSLLGSTHSLCSLFLKRWACSYQNWMWLIRDQENSIYGVIRVLGEIGGRGVNENEKSCCTIPWLCALICMRA